VLWIGGTANKNKDVFEQRFRKLAEQIEAEFKSSSLESGAEAPATVLPEK
jgi:cell division septum initiation protein DivIVA